MITIILLVIFNALVCNGMYMAMQEGQVLGEVQNLLGKVPIWIAKPLFYCITCMASIHSLYVFFPLALLFNIPLWLWLLHVPATAFVNTLFYDLLNYQELEDDNSGA
jgi:hypothetical protein